MAGGDAPALPERSRKDVLAFVSAVATIVQAGRSIATLLLTVLGLLLVPVQCAQGLHSLFIPAATMVAALERTTPHHQHSSDHHADHSGDARDDAMAMTTQTPANYLARTQETRSSAPERPVPSPVTSTTVDHPYTVALDRGGPLLDSLTALIRPLVLTPLAPHAIAVTPESPPPRTVA